MKSFVCNVRGLLEGSNQQFYPKLTLTQTYFWEFSEISGKIFSKREHFLLRVTDTSVLARYISNLVSP